MRFVRPTFWGNCLQYIKDSDCLAISKIYSNLHSVKLRWCKITDTGVRALTALSALSRLELQVYELKSCNCLLTSDGLQVLGVLDKLEKLSIAGACLTEEHGLKLDFIADLRSLLELKLDYSKITDTSLACLEGNSHLRKLSLYGCKGKITTYWLLRALRPLTELQKFRIRFSFRQMHRETHVDQLIDASAVIRILSKLRSLRKLHMGMLRVDDAMIQTLCDVSPELISLNFHAKNITDIAIRSCFFVSSG